MNSWKPLHSIVLALFLACSGWSTSVAAQSDEDAAPGEAESSVSTNANTPSITDEGDSSVSTDADTPSSAPPPKATSDPAKAEPRQDEGAEQKSAEATADDQHADEGRMQAEELRPQDYGDQPKESIAPDRARRTEVEPATEPEDYYLFLPRAILFLPNLALKTVFYPVRQVATFIDEYHVVPHIVDLLYNDARTAGIVPVIGYESDFGISGGAKIFHNDVFRNDEEVSLKAEYGGRYLQSYKFSFEADRLAYSPVWLEMHASFERHGGLQFWGIGNQSLTSADVGAGNDPREVALETRFRQSRYMASTLIGETIEEHSSRTKVGVKGIYNHRTFGAPSTRFSEPAVDEVYDVDQVTGFADGVDVFEVGPVFVYDSRDGEVFTSSGSYFDTFGSYAQVIGTGQGYWHYGIAAAGFIDLYGGTRNLSVRGIVEGVHGATDDIPFTELAQLGGPERLRGYGSGRFRDRLSAVATAEYRYPIHDYVAGEVFFDVGRVGATYADVFALSNDDPVRAGGGLGLVVHDGERVMFKAEAAYGEELALFLTSSPFDLFGERHERL